MKSRAWFWIGPSFFLIFLAFSLLLPPQNIYGQNLRPINVVPDEEIRSIIHVVNGYAYLGENTTLAETRAAAFANAKRQALEMAKTHIQSNTLVKDGILEYDVIQSGAKGAVSILEQKDYGLEGNRYHVWIRAEVEYALEPPAHRPSQAQIMSPNAPLTVKVWTPKRQYRQGENVDIYIQGNRDFYARIVSITSAGDIIQLLPNDYRQTNFFRGAGVYRIPDTGDRFSLEITPPFGEEQVVVYASEVPLGQVVTEPLGKGLRKYRGTLKLLATQTRSIKVVPKLAGSFSGAEFYEATWSLMTKE